MPLSTSVHIESKAAAERRAAAMKAEEHTGVSVIGEGTWFEERDTVTVPLSISASFRLSQQERDDLLRSLISSQALEGIEVPPDEAERILEEVLREPPPDIR